MCAKQFIILHDPKNKQLHVLQFVSKIFWKNHLTRFFQFQCIIRVLPKVDSLGPFEYFQTTVIALFPGRF